MQTKINKLPKSQVEIFIELSQKEMEPHIKTAAERLGQKIKIDGFRPGHIPYDVLKQNIGEMAIYQEALESLVNGTYLKILEQEDIEAVGQPDVEVIKMAPGNPLEFKVVVSVIPEITLGEIPAGSVKRVPIATTDDELNQTLERLQKMQSKESAVSRELQELDKAVLDIEMFLNKVPIEGGQARDHSIYLTEEYYIPGFKKEILGMKPDEERSFTLPFSKEHFQKHIAGKNVEFKVRLKQVFEVMPPEMDNEFAQSLGRKDLDDLRELVKKNLEFEKRREERDRVELESLEKLVEKCRFGDIPEVLINHEIERMLEELERTVASQGMEFSEYLNNHLKKNIADLKLEFVPLAIKRIKIALVSRQFAKENHVETSEEEIQAEIDTAKKHYQDEEHGKEINAPSYRAYIKNFLRNKKANNQITNLIAGEEN